MLSIIISTLAFFVAAWYLNRYLNEQEIAEGMTRRILVFVLASVVSAGVGMVVDKFDDKPAPNILSQPAAPQVAPPQTE